MTTVKLDKAVASKPAVHAFVLGVGTYPFLKNGSQEAQDTWGLGQLVSPPMSALSIARWLATEHSLPAIAAPNGGPGEPARPLGSIEVLISQGKHAAVFQDPSDPHAAPIEIDRAETALVTTAFDTWFDRANSHEDNLALFFFSGHGVELGQWQGLLLEEFGSSTKNPFRNVIDFNELVNGMDRCLARKQCFFADACRNTPDSLRELATASRGVMLIAPMEDSPTDTSRDAAVIRATAAHQSAFGVPGQPTRFTSALLRALRGAGCDQVGDQWHVRTLSLVGHLTELLSYESRTKTLPEQKATTGLGDGSGFTLHVPARPMVPITIACNPEADTALATLSIKRGDQVEQRPAAAPTAWELEVEVDAYDLAATFPDGKPERTKHVLVAPTLREVVL